MSDEIYKKILNTCDAMIYVEPRQSFGLACAIAVLNKSIIFIGIIDIKIKAKMSETNFLNIALFELIIY